MLQVQLRVSPEVAGSELLLRQSIARHIGRSPKGIGQVKIRKQNIDARHKKIAIHLTVDVYDEGEELPVDNFEDLIFPSVHDAPSAVVVGAGPCGLFAALQLIQEGIRPIILERGVDVMTRRRHLAELHKSGVVDPESNYSYGEGGAGAFSDGKLYTRSKKRGSVEKILRLFCKYGADQRILVEAHPHIGTDKLPVIIKRIREQIIASGGEVHFSTRMDSLLLDRGGIVRGVCSSRGEEFVGPVILATGHSARDIYRYLHQNNILIEAKAIAVGVRLEHPQTLIDQIRYRNPEGRGKWLPAAEYVYKTQVGERGVYSFCMCPGGFIVPASTAPNQTVVNGMSPANRGSKWANAGMVVELRPEDIPKTGLSIPNHHSPLALMDWCEEYERLSHISANYSLKAPSQRLTDFQVGKSSSSSPSSSYNLGLTPGNMHEWMPSFISKRLQEAFKQFEGMSRGFLTSEAQLIGVESRTSSPVRIPRHVDGEFAYQHLELRGLFPAGEGAGYAGGIVSAAIDGQNAATALARYLLGK